MAVVQIYLHEFKWTEYQTFAFFSSEVSNMASTSIDESLLVEFLEEDGVDVSTAKFLHVSFMVLVCKSKTEIFVLIKITFFIHIKKNYSCSYP